MSKVKEMLTTFQLFYKYRKTFIIMSHQSPKVINYYAICIEILNLSWIYA